MVRDVSNKELNTPAVLASVTPGSLIEARGIYKASGQTPALRGANVTVRPGEMDLLTHLARQQGATVALVTHDARIAAYADRVATVRDGIVSSVALPAVTASPAAAGRA
jgi:ABC-type sugar transport system ATPase subunit